MKYTAEEIVENTLEEFKEFSIIPQYEINKVIDKVEVAIEDGLEIEYKLNGIAMNNLLELFEEYKK